MLDVSDPRWTMELRRPPLWTINTGPSELHFSFFHLPSHPLYAFDPSTPTLGKDPLPSIYYSPPLNLDHRLDIASTSLFIFLGS